MLNAAFLSVKSVDFFGISHAADLYVLFRMVYFKFSRYNVSISSQPKLCCYTINEKSNERLEKENILQYVWQDAVTLRRHLGLGSTRRKKFLAVKVGYYPNSTSYFHQPRLILLSGDVELNPGMVDRQSEGNIKNIKIAHLNTRSLKNRAHYIQI